MISSLRNHTFGEPMPVKKARQYRESNAQKAVVKWLRDRPDWFVMSLENASKRTPAQAARARLLGMETGAPDLVLFYKRQAVFLEMKRAKGGRVSDEQQSVHRQLTMRGQVVLVAHGFDEAIEKLQGVEAYHSCPGCGRFVDVSGFCSSTCANG